MAAQKVMDARIILSAVDNASRVIARFETAAITRLTNVRKAADKISKASFAVGQQMGQAGLIAAGALALPIKKAMDFQEQMTDVRKVVSGLEKETAFKSMSRDVLRLGREIPLAHKELADLAAAGGRMGINRKHIIGYSRDVAKMSIAFDTAAGKIGEDMAKLSNVMGLPINKLGELGDAINYLDDNASAKGPDIIDVMRRAGGTARQLGMQAPNLAALASTFLSMGSGVEVAGTASNALMRELALANIQGERFQKGLKVIGLNAKEVSKGMAVDPQKTILAVLDKINTLPKSKQVEVTTQLFGKEYGDDIAKLGQGVKEYRRQLELLNDPKLKGSMQREFQARSKTTAAQVKLLKNNTNELLITLGTGLLPMVNKVVAAIIPVAQKITGWIEKNQKLANGIAMVVAGFAALTLSASALSFLVSGAASTISVLSKIGGVAVKMLGGKAKILLFITKTVLPSFLKILGFARTAILFVGRAVLMLGRALLMNPVGLIITAIGVAAFLVIKFWKPIKAFFVRLWEGVKWASLAFWEWAKKMFFNYHPFGLLIKHWVKVKGFFVNLWAGIKTVFYEAGKGLMNMLWKGIEIMIKKPIEAIKKMAKKIRDYLPFSPAKEGPLRDIHRVRIVETIAEGIDKKRDTIKRSMSMAISGGINSPAVNMGGAGGGGVSVNFSPNITINGGGADLKEQIISSLKQYQGDFIKLIDEAQRRKARVSF